MKPIFLILCITCLTIFSSCKSFFSAQNSSRPLAETTNSPAKKRGTTSDGNRIIVHSDKPINSDASGAKVDFKGKGNTIEITNIGVENTATGGKSVLIVEGENLNIKIDNTNIKDSSVNRKDTTIITGKNATINIDTENIKYKSEDSQKKQTIIVEQGSNAHITSRDFTDISVRSRAESALFAGDGTIIQDFPMMEGYYLLLAQAGDADAAYYLGKIFHIEYKFDAAIQYWEKGAEKNHVLCLQALGDMYQFGFMDHEPDREKAKTYYEKLKSLSVGK